MLHLEKLSAVVSRSFRISEITLSLGRDERLAVLGPNGSGKSYLLRLILGLERPSSGSISWGDRVLSRDERLLVGPESRGMGVVFQEGALFPHLDVRRNVGLALPKKGSSAEEREALIDKALELGRIRHLQQRSLQLLSGGEQQRVAIARALAHSPGLLLLDEPFHSLDGPLKREVLADLRALVEERGIATILVTHDTDEAASFAERVVLLRQGRLLQQGSYEQLYAEPVDLAAAELLGPIERLSRRQASAAAIELPAAVEGEPLYFRREHLQLFEPAPDAPRPLEIIDIRSHGLYYDVSVKLDDDSVLVSRMTSEAPWGVGARLTGRVTKAFAWSEEGGRRP
jgi:ABC-type sulfate/molybdate transport systems ATPase subunit